MEPSSTMVDALVVVYFCPEFSIDYLGPSSLPCSYQVDS